MRKANCHWLLLFFPLLLVYVQISTTTEEDIPEFDRTKVNLDIPPVVFGSGFTTITNISKILSNVITVSPSENSSNSIKTRSIEIDVILSRLLYVRDLNWRQFFFLFLDSFHGKRVTLHFIAKLSRFSTYIYIFFLRTSAMKMIHK